MQNLFLKFYFKQIYQIQILMLLTIITILLINKYKIYNDHYLLTVICFKIGIVQLKFSYFI